jgi:hypothetical protein
MKQVPLFSRGSLALPSAEHGGSLAVGRRKVARPFSRRCSLHAVLQSSVARGSWSLRRSATDARIRAAMRSLAPPRRQDLRICKQWQSPAPIASGQGEEGFSGVSPGVCRRDGAARDGCAAGPPLGQVLGSPRVLATRALGARFRRCTRLRVTKRNGSARHALPPAGARSASAESGDRSPGMKNRRSIESPPMMLSTPA